MMKRKTLFLLLIICAATALSADIRTGIVTYLQERNISREMIVLLTAMLPIFELRLAIPIGIGVLHLSWLQTFIFAVIGNMIPVIPILLLLEWIYSIFAKWKYTKRFIEWIFERTKKNSGNIEKYEIAGLIFFVAVPLPGTGAWTGSFAAVLLGISFLKSVLSVFAGVLIAGVIVTVLTLMGVWGALIALLAAASVLTVSLVRTKK